MHVAGCIAAHIAYDYYLWVNGTCFVQYCLEYASFPIDESCHDGHSNIYLVLVCKVKFCCMKVVIGVVVVVVQFQVFVKMEFLSCCHRKNLRCSLPPNYTYWNLIETFFLFFTDSLFESLLIFLSFS